MRGATCGTGAYDRDLWFPEMGDAQGAQRAKDICNTECPVRDLCRDYAVNFPVVLTGVWGGLSRRELRAERVTREITVISEAQFSKLPRDVK